MGGGIGWGEGRGRGGGGCRGRGGDVGRGRMNQLEEVTCVDGIRTQL